MVDVFIGFRNSSRAMAYSSPCGTPAMPRHPRSTRTRTAKRVNCEEALFKQQLAQAVRSPHNTRVTEETKTAFSEWLVAWGFEQAFRLQLVQDVGEGLAHACVVQGGQYPYTSTRHFHASRDPAHKARRSLVSRQVGRRYKTLPFRARRASLPCSRPNTCLRGLRIPLRSSMPTMP